MNYVKLFSIICVAGLIMSGCNKTQPAYNYTFVNPTDQPITVDIYLTEGDYDNDSNLIISGVAPANGTFVVPSSKFIENHTYFYDFYNKDYTYTNWQNPGASKGPNTITFIPSADAPIKRLESAPDYIRLLCLNGNATSTTWVAIDGYEFTSAGKLGWDQLTPIQKYFQITFRKNFSTTYYYKIDSTKIWTSGNMTYNTHEGGLPNGSTSGNFLLAIGNEEYYLGNVTYNLTKPSGTPGAAIGDTITVNLDEVGGFKMVKVGQPL